jgi:hypothetical protein
MDWHGCDVRFVPKADICIEQEVQVPYRYGIFVALLHIGLLWPYLFLRVSPLLGDAASPCLALAQHSHGRHVMIVANSIDNGVARYKKPECLNREWSGYSQIYPKLIAFLRNCVTRSIDSVVCSPMVRR